MFPMDRKTPAVIVEYDCRGKRVRKVFEDAYKGRQFYTAKYNAHKHPKVVVPGKKWKVVEVENGKPPRTILEDDDRFRAEAAVGYYGMLNQDRPNVSIEIREVSDEQPTT